MGQRLIDADRLKRHYAWWGQKASAEIFKEFKHTFDIIVDLQPTVEVKEENRPHGEWIADRLVTTSGGTYGVKRCSLCEAYFQDVGYGFNYCPNCGAKMEVSDAEHT